jgi:Glycosyltransferase family 87
VAVTGAGALAAVRALHGPMTAPEPTRANTMLTAGQDFRDATYFPLRELLRGGDPYRPSTMFEHWPVHQELDLYTPHHLLLQLPLVALPYRPALLVFAVASIGCLVALAVLVARTAELPGGALGAAALAVALLASQVGKSAVDLGQINPLVGLGAALALTQAGRRDRWAALGLALAWVKPQYGIPLSLLLLARGLWRPVVTGTVGALLASLPVLAVLLARTGIAGFVDDVRANLDYATAVPYSAVTAPDGARVDLAAVVVRLAGWTGPSLAVTLLQVAVPVVVLGSAGWLLARRRGRAMTAGDQLLAGLALLLALVHQPSETLLLLPAVVALLVAAVRGGSRWWALAALLVSVSLLRVSAVQSAVAATIGPRPERLVEGLCLLTAYVIAVVLARRHVPS